jgi:hypothetical protein
MTLVGLLTTTLRVRAHGAGCFGPSIGPWRSRLFQLHSLCSQRGHLNWVVASTRHTMQRTVTAATLFKGAESTTVTLLFGSRIGALQCLKARVTLQVRGLLTVFATPRVDLWMR